MNLKHKDPEIPKDKEDDPFVNCKLDRKKYALILTDLLNDYAEGFVLAINNPWGQGKTIFIKMWRQHLINNDFQTLYFNAWENDFQEEVIIALLSELEEFREKAGERFDELLKGAATFLKKLGPAVAKGVMTKAVGEGATSDIVQALTEFTTEQVEEAIIGFKEKKKGIVDFRKNLEQYANKINNEKPLVFFIDELDRCRPSYAVEVIEQVKHLFSVPGIIFVLSIDKVQLGHAIRGYYGSHLINADEYLRRFIDLEYSIPQPEYEQIVSYLFHFYDYDKIYAIDERTKSYELQNEKKDFIRVLEVFFAFHRFSFRSQERILAHIRVVLNTFSKNQYTLPEIITLLVILKNYDNDIYEKIVNKKYTVQELINVLEEKYKSVQGENAGIAIVFAIGRLIYSYSNFIKAHSGRELLSTDTKTGSISLTVKSKINEERLLGTIQGISSNHSINSLDLSWLINRVELMEKISG